MRVVHLHNRFDHKAGGIVAALGGLTRAQVNAGLDTHMVLTTMRDEDISPTDRLVENGVQVQIVGPCSTPLRLHPTLRLTVERAIAAADVVHIHGVWEQIQHLGAQAAWRQGKPYVITPHGMLDPYTLSMKRLKKRAYRAWRLDRHLERANGLHFHTQIERDLVLQPMGFLNPDSHIIIEPSGLDLREFHELPAPGGFRQRLGLPAAKKILLFMSRIHAKKGLDILVPAFAQAELEDAILVIAGPNEGGYLSEVEKMVSAHGVSDRVMMPGMLYGNERLEAMVDADLFVLPSYQENFGMVVIESLAAGTAVLISDQVNLHPEVTAAQVGEVAPAQPDRFVDMMQRWMRDPAMREAAHARARPYALEHFDWDVIAEHWVQHYQHIADG